MGMVVPSCNSNACEARKGGTWMWGQPSLHSQYQASNLSYTT
jgi:hypothetical protein